MTWILRAVILAIDYLLVRLYKIEPFTQANGCIFRIALVKNDKELILSDGTMVYPGETVAEIHFWNERIPKMPPGGPDLAWGQQFYRLLRRSLTLLAEYVQRDPRFAQVRAFRGETTWVPRVGALNIPAVVQHLGFDLIFLERKAGPLRRFLAFWDNLYTWGLIWTYNPGALIYKDILRSERCRFWISKESLIRHYGNLPKGQQPTPKA